MDVDLDRNSVVVLAFPLSAEDLAGANVDISADVVDVIIKPVGVRPVPTDEWTTCFWSMAYPGFLEVLINTTTGHPSFDVTHWDPGTYWWFARPHDETEVPVLQGANYIQVV